jgi:tRNA A-37 threonylcarbamoyl transferase component Bud32
VQELPDLQSRADTPLPDLGSPSDLARGEGASRARMFAVLALVLSVNVFLLLPFIGGDVHARHTFAVALVPAALGSLWLIWALRKEPGHAASSAMAIGAVCLVAALAGIRYFGVFSPAVAILPVGLFFIGFIGDVRAELGGYVATSLSYVGLVAFTLRGGRHDPGIIAGLALSPAQALVMVVLVEITLLLTFLSLRTARSATVLALARHDRVVRGVAQRDALLAEVRKDLARALDVAGVGRFSDTSVGRYHLGNVIGRGAMGEVYEAIHEDTRAEAAVKLLHTHTLRDPGTVERFLREAKMATAVETPHAVRILEVGGFDGELPYIAMERLRGEDLAELLRQSPRLPWPSVIRLLREVGKGLVAARLAGVVHRDLKPRNVFLAETDGEPLGRWKILDFGVSKHGGAEVTQTKGRIVGTPEYMAPEQAAGEAVSHRTDLFSLGAIAYRALTGTAAFSGDHIAEVLYQIAHGMPLRPSSVTGGPPEVDLVLAVALAKDPADRFESGDELADALEAAAKGEIAPAVKVRAEAILMKHPWREESGSLD